METLEQIFPKYVTIDYNETKTNAAFLLLQITVAQR